MLSSGGPEPHRHGLMQNGPDPTASIADDRRNTPRQPADVLRGRGPSRDGALVGGPRKAPAGSGRARRSRDADVAGRLSRPLARARAALQPDLRLSPGEPHRAGGEAHRDTRATTRLGCESARYASARHRPRECGGAESVGDLRGCRWPSTARPPTRVTTSGGTSCPPARTCRPSSERSSPPAPIAPASACVAAGEADACAVDCVTHALLSDQAADELRGTRILTSSPNAPAMPYVTSAATPDDDIERMRAGLLAAIADPLLAPARRELRLIGASVLTDDRLPEGIRGLTRISHRGHGLRGAVRPTE